MPRAIRSLDRKRICFFQASGSERSGQSREFGGGRPQKKGAAAQDEMLVRNFSDNYFLILSVFAGDFAWALKVYFYPEMLAELPPWAHTRSARGQR
jgi:hypothetical protein